MVVVTGCWWSAGRGYDGGNGGGSNVTGVVGAMTDYTGERN